jgi:hypothetical protein
MRQHLNIRLFVTAAHHLLGEGKFPFELPTLLVRMLINVDPMKKVFDRNPRLTSKPDALFRCEIHLAR